MLSFSIKGMQINRAYIFLINWKTYIINDYSKWTNDCTDKMTDHVSKVCLPQLFKIILKHPKRTGNYCILSSLWHIYQPFYFWNKRCEMPQKKHNSNSNQKIFLSWQVYCQVLGNTGGESARAETMANYIAHISNVT